MSNDVLIQKRTVRLTAELVDECQRVVDALNALPLDERHIESVTARPGRVTLTDVVTACVNFGLARIKGDHGLLEEHEEVDGQSWKA